jgi:hypothetical protein
MIIIVDVLFNVQIILYLVVLYSYHLVLIPAEDGDFFFFFYFFSLCCATINSINISW